MHSVEIVYGDLVDIKVEEFGLHWVQTNPGGSLVEKRHFRSSLN